MSRLCSTCGHPDRKSIEDRVLSGGTSIRLISIDYPGLNEQAIARHCRNHTVRAFREQLRSSTASLHVEDFGSRLVALMDATAQVRDEARQLGDRKLALDAIRSEVSTIATLTSKLGIDGDELLEVVQELRQYQVASVRVLARHPEILRELSDQLHRDGLGSLSDDLDHLATRAEQHLALPSISKERA